MSLAPTSDKHVIEVGSSMQGSRCTSAKLDFQVHIRFPFIFADMSNFLKTSARGLDNSDSHNSNLVITAISEHGHRQSKSFTEKNKSSGRS